MSNNNPRIVDLSQVKAACKACSLQELCLPLGINREDLEYLDRIVRHRRPLSRGQHIYRTGDPFESLFAVRSGAVKTYTVSNEGTEHVTGFHLPGELLGLDAILKGHHGCSACTLDTTSLCEIPFDRLEALSGELPSLRHQLFRIMSREIGQEEDLLLLGKQPSEQRLATFLINLSNRYAALGYSAQEFNLVMSRNDIANYLGLAVETVSRNLSRFQEQGLIDVRHRHVRLHDREGLERLTVPGECSDSRRGTGSS